MSTATIKKIKKALTGNEAGAEAMRQIDPDVAAVFPITPQTELMHAFAAFVADGKVGTELVTVESEHSAMSATVGAAAAGARAMTATSANGLALMWEIVNICSAMRLPVVMPVINRAISGPLNIHCDHSDMMGSRDTGWIQIFSENSQEEYDNIIQAVRIAENPNVLLPVMVGSDGFIISHALETVEIYEDAEVKEFVGEYTPDRTLLNTGKPMTYGPLDLQDYYMEHKMAEHNAIHNAGKVILEIGKEFGKKFGTEYGFFDTYKMEDAEYAIICIGSTAGTTRVVVDKMRAEGKKVGLIKIRVFRPFPFKELAEAVKNLKGLAVLDRADTFGGRGGPLYIEMKSALSDVKEKPVTRNFIYGLGGRDINTTDIETIYNQIEETVKTGKGAESFSYFGVRGDV
ncbi:MAG: pyruvate ferredoxin oxidoreductase [Firmicutes bacterium]|nr:pyruvate ferredoxin oxidoreductase [Bacillota bacterium]